MFYLSSQFCYCGGLLSNVEPYAVCPSPWTLSYHKCIQCIHIGNICLCYMVCVSWEFSVLKLTFLWRRQWPHLLPDIWKHCKILKMPCLRFQIGFVFSSLSKFPSNLSTPVMLTVKGKNLRMCQSILFIMWVKVCKVGSLVSSSLSVGLVSNVSFVLLLEM